MRPPQNNKRMRGRSNNSSSSNNNRRGPNPLTRSYESNGPDTKVRGTAAHIAEKYVQLARDAHVASDPVAAENYLQHAEHYFRLIAAAQAALNPPPRVTEGAAQTEASADESDDDDFDGGINDRFTYHSPQSYHAPQVNTSESGGEAQVTSPVAEQPSIEQPYAERNDQQRSFEPRHTPRNEYRNEGRNGSRFEGRRDNNRDRNPERAPRNEFPRSEPRSSESRYSENRYQENRPSEQRPERSYEPVAQENNRYDGNRTENNRQEASRQEGGRYDAPRRDRQFRSDRNFEPRNNFEPRTGFEQRPSFEPRNNFEAKNNFELKPERSSSERFERPTRSLPPEIADVQPILPSFITAPVRAVVTPEPVVKDIPLVQEPVKTRQPRKIQIETDDAGEKPAPKPRRKRVVKAHEEDSGSPLETSVD